MVLHTRTTGGVNNRSNVTGYSRADDREDKDGFVPAPHRVSDDGSYPRRAVGEESVELVRICIGGMGLERSREIELAHIVRIAKETV